MTNSEEAAAYYDRPVTKRDIDNGWGGTMSNGILKKITITTNKHYDNDGRVTSEDVVEEYEYFEPKGKPAEARVSYQGFRPHIDTTHPV